jgi:hypothetical protein
MTDGSAPPSDPVPEKAPGPAADGEPAGGGTSKTDTEEQARGFLHRTVGVLVGTEKMAARIAGFITSIGVIVGAIALLSHGSASPAAIEASFLKTSVQQGVLLEQYEEENRPLNADYEPGDDSTGVGVREVSLVAFKPATSTPASATAPATAGFSNPEAEREEAEKLSQEAKLKQAQAQIELEKQKEEARQRQAKAREEKSKEETHVEVRTTEREDERLQNAGHLRQQAETEAENARLKANEAEKVKREEEHPGSAPAQPLPPVPLHREGEADVAVGTSPPRGEVDAVIRQAGVPLPSKCRVSCALSPTIDKALGEYAANSDEAARQVASIFHDSRQGVFGRKREPLGVAVHFSIDLIGYAGQLLVIDWTLCSAQTGRPLPREWLRNVPAEVVRPTSNRLKRPGNFWAPLPPKHGRYYFRLRVFDSSNEVVQTQTQVFH